MVAVQPVHGAAAATVHHEEGRLLVIADYHAGIESGLRYREGVHIPSRADERRARLLGLIDAEAVDELVVVGDLMHSIGDPAMNERAELETLVDALPDSVALSVIKGNHDGDLEGWLDEATVHEPPGVVRQGLALSHGHTWPPAEALDADVLVIGHEHPRVRLEDAVGGSVVHRVWVRGRLDVASAAEHLGREAPDAGPTLVVMPAFNELSGGTWINVDEDSFLVPYLPDGIVDPGVYLLDGTGLGRIVAPPGSDRP